MRIPRAARRTLCLAAATMVAGAMVAGAARAAAGQASEDLTRALQGSGARRLSAPPRLQRLPWRRIGADDAALRLRIPFALCWRGASLVVADRDLAKVVVFAPDGRFQRAFGERGTAPGQFGELTVVRCADDRVAFLTADLATRRVSLLDTAGGVVASAPLPEVPQIDVVGEFALGRGGTWYESWLGSDVSFGPYLSDAQWQRVALVRQYERGRGLQREFGTPVPYRDRVARRVLNRVFYAPWRDTLWTLTQGDATIRGFAPGGAPVGRPIELPVHFRGPDPEVELGRGVPQSDFVPNTMAYDPNVTGLAVLRDSLFATARHRDWGLKLITGGGVTLRRMAASSVEIVDRRGRVLRAYDAPGMIVALAADGGSRIAIITRQRDNTRHVYVADVPR